MSTGPSISQSPVFSHFDALDRALNGLTVTDLGGSALDCLVGLRLAGTRLREASAAGCTVFVVGNGGSAGIASQITYELTHNRALRALGFGDGSALTGLSSSYGYDQVFSRQLKAHGRRGDQLIAISSSGASANILNAVVAARETGLGVLTLSGFKSDNPLRQAGDLNFYVASSEYGFVEIAHLAVCHAILDRSEQS